MTALSVNQVQVQAKKHHDDDNNKPTGSSAMERGAHDATCGTDDNCDHLYMNQPGKGFEDHSKKFNKNYIKGFCAADGSEDTDVEGGSN